MAEPTFRRMDAYVSGLEVAPKVSTIIPNLELGKPHVFPLGSKIARSSNDTDGRGCDKKQMPVCNAQDRDLCPDVKTCWLITGVSKQKRLISVNVGYPEIPNGTGLTDRKNCQQPSTQFARAVKMTDAWKGRDAPERSKGKLLRSVRRRGEAGNCFFLSNLGEGKRVTVFSYLTITNLKKLLGRKFHIGKAIFPRIHKNLTLNLQQILNTAVFFST